MLDADSVSSQLSKLEKSPKNKCAILCLLVIDRPTLGMCVRHHQHDWMEVENPKQDELRFDALIYYYCTFMVYKMWGNQVPRRDQVTLDATNVSP